MRRILALAFFSFLLSVPLASATDGPSPFQLIYRHDNVVSGEIKTTSNLMINVINRSGIEAKDLAVYISAPNPYLFIDMPVFIGTIPDGHQAEFLQKTELPNMLIATSEPEDNIVWRIEYTNSAGERTAVDVKGEQGI